MSADNGRTSRRAFVLKGGATLGAGVAVAATAGAAALSGSGTAEEQLARRQDIDAIRRVHAGFIAGVEAATQAPAVDTHRAYRANARQIEDMLDLSADRRHAIARWHVDVQVVTPLAGDSTIAQMARLQGNRGATHWESGRLAAGYEKTRGTWRLTDVHYEVA